MLTAVTHTDHNRADILQCRVTEHGNLVLWFVVRFIVQHVWNSVAHSFVSCAFGFVTRQFGGSKGLEFEIEHILCRPNGNTINSRIIVIHTRWSQMQRNLIFVIVIAKVTTQTDETGQVSVFQVRVHRLQFLRMNEHLQILILTHVITGVLVHCSRVMRTEVHDAVGLTTHTRW